MGVERREGKEEEEEAVYKLWQCLYDAELLPERRLMTLNCYCLGARYYSKLTNSIRWRENITYLL